MRRALFSIMLVGIVAVGATLGGLAAFSDTEKSSGNTFTAGEFDLKVDWVQYWNGELEENQSFTDLNEMPIFTLDDVKPGDSGKAAISLHVFTNDAWLCMELSPTSADDVSSNEPESLVDNQDNEDCFWDGELAQNLYIELWQENDGNMEFDPANELPIYSGFASDIPFTCSNGCEDGGTFWYNLDQNLHEGDGLQPLIGCENYYIGMNWWIDPTVGNVIQSDEFSFDISFFAYQYRHQEDNNPCVGPSCEDLETLYLADCGDPSADGEGTTLFEVVLDNTANRANLTEMTVLSADYWDQVAAIACSADGENIYVIDKTSKKLGIYNVSTETFEDRGMISNLPGGVVLAAFSPDGDLYAASDDTNKLYTIDNIGGAPYATSEGLITKSEGETLNIMGADLVFDAEGTLYVWTNSNPPGLYEVDLGTMTAVLQGHPDEAEPYFTGLAIRAAGTGKLVGSTNSSYIWEVAKTDASIGTAFDPWFDNEPYDVGYGDMTVGILCVYPEETD